MTTYDWPANLKPDAVAFNQRGMSVSGPPSMTGRTQVASIDAGFWTASLSLVLRRQLQIRSYRQLRALLEGGTHHIRLPVFDCYRTAFGEIDGSTITALSDVTFSDGSFFADGAEFYQQPITVELTEAADIGDMSVTVDVTFAGEIIGGEFFSIGDRLYVIKQILADGAEDSPPTTIQMWSIWPRMREDWPIGTQLNFARPICRMRLVEEGSMDLALSMLRFDNPVLSFVEAIDDE